VKEMFKRLSKRAQTIAEYAILIAIVVGAVVAMQIYIKRGMQGRVKDVVDYTGDAMFATQANGSNFGFSSGQYEPYYSNSSTNSTQSANETERLGQGLNASRSANTAVSSNRTGQTGW